MKLFTIVSVIFTGTAIAAPQQIEERQYVPCFSGLYSTALCCAADVINALGVDCVTPPTLPTSPDQFTSTCTGVGKSASCCAIPLLGQAIACQTPSGVKD
ncbi:hypothetical protein B7463_g4912, partial [Scytalidium lignicola]